MLEKLFYQIKPAIHFCISRPWTVLISGILLAIVSTLLATNLRIGMDPKSRTPRMTKTSKYGGSAMPSNYLW